MDGIRVRGYDDLVGALKSRQVELGLTNEKLDELSGLPAGYVGKLFGPSQMKKLAPYIALGVLLEALGLRMTVAPDPEASAQLRERWGGRERPVGDTLPPRACKRAKVFPGMLFRILSRRAVMARREKVPPARRAEIARQAARARWDAMSPERRQKALARVRRRRGKVAQQWRPPNACN